jgi:hypothetical protein
MAVIKNETGTHSLEVEADGSINVNLTANGGATAAKQDVGNTSLSSIDTKLSGTLSVNVVNQIDLTTITSHLLAIKNSVAAIDANTDTLEQKLIDVVTAINTNGSVNHADLASVLTQLQAINANTDGQEALLSSILAKIIASPATLSEQQTQSTSLASIDTKLSSPLTVNVGLTDTQLRASAVPVSVSGVATSANQTTGNSSLSSIDTKTPALVTGRVPVDGSGVTQPVSFTRLSSGTDSVTVSGTVTSTPSGTQTVSGTVAATQSGVWNVTNVSGTVSLPTGAATAAKQLADNHQVTVSNFPATQSVSVASLPLPTGSSTSALQTSGNSTLTAIDTKLGATLSVNVGLTDTQLRASAVPISVASLPLPSGAATSALQTTGNVSLTAIDSKLGGTLTVNVGLTDTQLRASAVPVTVSGVSTAANQTTGNSSLSSIDSKITAVDTGAVVVSSSALPTDASTATLQSAGNVSVASIDTKTPALIAGRQPVTTKDYGYDVALGNISGSSTITLRGYNQATSTTNEPLWAQSGTSYPTVTAAQTLTISSSSANDTVAGTGARTVAVTYILRSTGAEVTTVFNMNGVTPVTITTDGQAVNSVRVLTIGTGLSNAGVIYVGYGTVTAGVPANILSTIVIGKNNAQQAIYTVPATKVLDLWAYRLSSSILTYIQFRTVAANGGIMVVEFDIPLNGVTAFTSVAPSSFAAGTQIQIWGQSTAAGAAGCLISGYLRSV